MLTNTIITNIHSQKEMDKVEEVLVKLGNIVDGITNYNNGNFPIIKIYGNGKFMSYLNDNRDYHLITAKEFFAKYDTPVKIVDKPKFKVGDRVRIKDTPHMRIWVEAIPGKTFIFNPVDDFNQDEWIESNKPTCGMDKENTYHINYRYEDLELVEAPQPLKNTIITNITSQEQHNRVQKKLISLGNRMVRNDCSCDSIKVYSTSDKGFNSFNSDEPVFTYECDSWPHITASEFLGEDEPSGVCGSSGHSEPNAEVSTGGRIEPPTQTTGVAEGMIKCLEVNINKNNPSSEPCVGKEKTKKYEYRKLFQ